MTELFERLLRLDPDMVRGWINGLEGTRKTSLALTLWEEYYKDRGYELIMIPPTAADAETLYLSIKTSPSQKVFVLLDDLSYRYHYASSEFREFAQLLVTARHWSKRKIVIVIISHYAHSVPPMLRQAHIVAFTSLASEEELWMAMRYFPPSYVLEFRERWRHSMDYFLVGVLGEVGIIRLPPYRPPPAHAFSWAQRVKQVKEDKQGHNGNNTLFYTVEEEVG